jgi:predicted TIM-barrel fold metal-dependent hydrolase
VKLLRHSVGRPGKVRAARKLASLLLLLLLLLLLPTSLAWSQAKQEHAPIIDMHLHAYKVADFGVGLGPSPASCPTNEDKVWYGWDPRTPLKLGKLGSCATTKLPAPNTDDELMRQTLAMLERYNIQAVTSGDSGAMDLLNKWHAAAPGRVIPAIEFLQPGHDSQGNSIYRPIAELRELVAKENIAVFAEIAPQYDGMSPADPKLEPYFALAEELDIPVGLHMGEGPPGGPNVEGYSKYRVRMGNPLLLEDVLIRHPKLRIYVMHFGSPFVDDMIALLFSYPQLYIDIAGNDSGFPRKHFHSQLRRLVDAGFGKRIMFGSDQMIWPDAIRLSIETIESADFLTEEQKRDIFYNNAARFLRLDEKGQLRR